MIKPPTQADIARAAGVHRTTVSMSLRDHPRIPKETRDHVQRIAKELGYAPDPMLVALSQYRKALRPSAYQGTIGWLVNNRPGFDWMAVSMFREQYEGARESARVHGYNLEVFHLNSPGITATRLAGILRSRNVSGLILCAQPRPNTKLEFPWDDFSFVALGYSLVSPRFDTVAPTQFTSTVETMQRLRRLGYSRIGFAYSTVTDERAAHNFYAGYLINATLHDAVLPPFDEELTSGKAFQKWFKRHRPDAVITGNPRILRTIKSAGFQVPADFGVASPTVPGLDSDLSGICEASHQVGVHAVDFLVAQMHRNHRGVPLRPTYLHVPGVWVRGKTLRYPEGTSLDIDPDKIEITTGTGDA